MQADSLPSEPQGSPFYAKLYAKTSHLGHSCFSVLFCQGGKKIIPNKQFVFFVVYNGGFENFFYKDPVNISDSVVQTSVAATQLWSCSMKAA